MQVLADANLSYYMVLASSYITPQSVSVKPKSSFWFPAVNAKAGDNIILYTGSGLQKTEPAIGYSNHFFYWGLGQTVWKGVGECAILLELGNWQTSPYG